MLESRWLLGMDMLPARDADIAEASSSDAPEPWSVVCASWLSLRTAVSTNVRPMLLQAMRLSPRIADRSVPGRRG